MSDYTWAKAPDADDPDAIKAFLDEAYRKLHPTNAKALDPRERDFITGALIGLCVRLNDWTSHAKD